MNSVQRTCRRPIDTFIFWRNLLEPILGLETRKCSEITTKHSENEKMQWMVRKHSEMQGKSNEMVLMTLGSVFASENVEKLPCDGWELLWQWTQGWEVEWSGLYRL